MAPAKEPLNSERIVAVAVELADKLGVDALTIRKLAVALDTKPMSIYHHVPNKEAILDGMVDEVFREIELPPVGLGWRAAISVRCESVRQVLRDHPWATPMMESRTNPGLETLRHHDAVLGCFRRAGFSVEMTAHAYSIIDSYVYGFALQEAAIPFDSEGDISDVADSILDPLPEDAFPYLVELTTQHVLQPGYSYQAEFEFGLDLILDGLERSAVAE